MIFLQPVQAGDADALFPLVFAQRVTDTLVWDGPESLESFRDALEERAGQVARGERHIFTILEPASAQPVGSASIRPDAAGFRGDLGLWIGQPYHNRGYGTQVVHKLVDYGFATLKLEKVEGFVFVGNWASRRIFEKNRFQLEGTIRKAVRKRGLAIDEWLFSLTREDWQAHIQTGEPPHPEDFLYHICQPQDWRAAQEAGEYSIESLFHEGFIHCSRLDQVLKVANHYFRDVQPLALLWIDPLRVRVPIKWESAGEEYFPHIYGPLKIEAVVAMRDFSPDPDGVFRSLPAITLSLA